MFAMLFGGKHTPSTQADKKNAWKRTPPKATVISARRIAHALRGKSLSIPGKGCTIHAIGFTITFSVHPVVVGGDVTARIKPGRGMKLPAHIGILKLTEHNGSVTKSFGGSGEAVINGVIKGTYKLSLT